MTALLSCPFPRARTRVLLRVSALVCLRAAALLVYTLSALCKHLHMRTAHAHVLLARRRAFHVSAPCALAAHELNVLFPCMQCLFPRLLLDMLITFVPLLRWGRATLLLLAGPPPQPVTKARMSVPSKQNWVSLSLPRRAVGYGADPTSPGKD